MKKIVNLFLKISAKQNVTGLNKYIEIRMKFRVNSDYKVFFLNFLKVSVIANRLPPPPLVGLDYVK